MKLMNGKLIAFALLTFSIGAQAQDLELGEPSYGGTGCPAGSASVSLSPDSKSLSLLFDQYVVEAGDGRAIGRKNCNIAIPVRVPSGYSVSVFAIDYRGFVGLPSGSRATLNVDYFLAGQGRGVRSSKSFTGPRSTDYLTTDRLGMEAVVWTGCGANTILRANTSMMVQNNNRREMAMATVDSADVNAGLIYHLQWKRCN